jgi:hypothetical protein
MQRRYAVIAAIALIALVLIPAAALASGPGGFGHRGIGPGPKNISQAAADPARNATHPDWAAGNRTGAGRYAGNTSRIGNLTCDRDHACEHDGDCLGNVTGGQHQNRTQLRDPGCALDRTGNATARSLGPQGRGGRGPGR